MCLAYSNQDRQSWKKTQLARLKYLRRLGGRVTHIAPERIGQVRLVEVADFVSGIEDGLALLQKSKGFLGAFDLLDGFLGQTGGL